MIVPVVICLCILLISILSLVKENLEISNVESLTGKSKEAGYQVSDFFTQYIKATEAFSKDVNLQKFFQNLKEGTLISQEEGFEDITRNMDNLAGMDKDNIMATWVAYVDSSQIVISDGFIGTPPNWDINSRDWFPLVKEKNSTVLTAPYVDASTGLLVVSTIAPVFDDNNKIIGVAGFDISLENLNGIMSNYKLGETGFFVFIADNGTIVYDKKEDDINKNIKEIGLSEKVVKSYEEKSEGSLEYEKDGQKIYGYYSFIGDTGWSVLSSLPEKEFYQEYNALLRLSVIIFIAVLLILSIVIVIIARGTVKPLKKLALNVNEIAEGNLDVEVDTNSADETGQVAEGLERTVVRLKEYIEYINEISFILKEMASGNLMFELKQEYVGEFSKIKEALLDIQEIYIKTFSEIAVSADQVATGSEQLAQGAQLLSQGSMQQASSVEELSATIIEISNEIKKNAENANIASDISSHSEKEVKYGDQQMVQMIKAMDEIRSTSNQISNIIKAIDDIAFQTNILALNAAVEAARAGEAGKGFAVVADEVRNLAAKSGEAAKDTTSLIETAIAAVENGTKIVDETAASLEKIVFNAKKSATVIGEITDAGNQQADSMSQVTVGVDQISTVVQTNSATAEETAAASEELSSQANVLKQLISQFKIN